eukprot:328784_1
MSTRSINIHPFIHVFFWLLINVAKTETIATVTCGDSISSDIISHMSVYELIVYENTSYITLGGCYSQDDVVVKVYNNMNESISDLFCPNNGNYCNACMTGSCENCDLYDNYYNTFTLAITDTTSSYYIHVKYLDESLSTGSYKIDITCTKAEYETVKCGDLISGNILPTNKWEFYQFIVDKPVMVTIDSCYSQSDLAVNFWGKVWNNPSTKISHQYCPWSDECGICDNCNSSGHCYNENFTIPITPGSVPLFVRYYIGITYWNWYDSSTHGSYHISVTCNPYPLSDRYKLISLDGLTLTEAELICERTFGTTLASISSSFEANIALQLMDVNTSSWIGLYSHKAITDDEFMWIDRRHDNIPVITNTNYRSDVNYEMTIGTILTLNDDQYVYSAVSDKDTSVQSILCNGFWVTRYDYWGQLYVIRNRWTRLQVDVVYEEDYYLFTMYYKNMTNFIFINDSIAAVYKDGDLEILLVQLALEEYKNITITKHRAIQYKSSFMVYFSHYDGDTNIQFEILYFDIISLQIDLFIIPSEYSSKHVELCMVRDKHNLYVLTSSYMLIYNVTSTELVKTIKIWNSDISACVSDFKERFIYIFGKKQSIIYKYNIQQSMFTFIEQPNLCQTGIGSAIIMPNNKAYLHGCYITSWKTLIFNMDTNTFEGTADINIVTIKNIPYYQTGRLIIKSDETIHLIFMTHPQYPLYNSNDKSYSLHQYFLTTDWLMIRFEPIVSSASSIIWPSDGINIQYYVINRLELTNNFYHVQIYCDNISAQINESLVLNATKDGCDCPTVSQCENCAKYFALQNYITLMDNNITELTLHMSAKKYVFGANQVAEPFLPVKYISISLQRCIITFYNVTTQTNNNNPSIRISYTLINECYLRNKTNYSLNVTVIAKSGIDMVYGHYGVNINIVHGEHNCTVCTLRTSNRDCSICNNNTIEIRHDVLDHKETLYVSFESNMIDLAIDSTPINSIEYFQSPVTNFTDWIVELIVLFVVIICFILFSILIICKREYDKAFIVNRALVLIIGISQFDDKTALLSGVRSNVNDLKGLWGDKYNYDVFICNFESLYCQKQDIIDFIDG